MAIRIRIPVAKYINNNVEKLIYAKDIDKKEYEKKYRGSLFCKENGCSARLHHVDKNPRFFRTNRGSKHIEGCPSLVVYDKIVSSFDNNGMAIEIPDKDLLKKLKRVRNKYRNKSLTNNGSGSRNNSYNNEGQTRTKSKPNTTYSISGDGKENSKNKKNARFLNREVSKISPKDYEKIRIVNGTLSYIEIMDDYIYIIFKETNYFNLKVMIELGNPFKDNSPQCFEILKKMKNYINPSNYDIDCTCIGLVTEHKECILIKTFKECELLFEEDIIINFYNKLKETVKR